MNISLSSTKHSNEWKTKKIVSKELPCPDVPSLVSLTTIFVDFLLCFHLQSSHLLPNDQGFRKHNSFLCFSFFKCGCLISLWFILLLLLPPFVVRSIRVFLMDQIGTRRLSFALAFSSTSIDSMRSATLNSCLLYFTVVKKSLHEDGNLVIISPATNLLGKTEEKCPSSFAGTYVSWVHSTMIL